MLRQKRNLSEFRKYQEHINNLLNEETAISDYSDDENVENKSFNSNTSYTNLNISTTTTRNGASFYCTPPAKRLKRNTLSTVHQRPALQIQRPKTVTLNHERNTTVGVNAQEENEDQELTIEWSSSDESAENTVARLSKCETQTTQKSATTTLPSSQNLTPSSSIKSKSIRRCRKGGYLQQLQQTLAHAKTDRKFLEHDKKFRIREFACLHVLKIENSFGVHLAKVRTSENEIYEIILNDDIAQNVRAGTLLEAFLEQINPYELEYCGEVRRILIEPFKIMIH